MTGLKEIYEDFDWTRIQAAKLGQKTKVILDSIPRDVTTIVDVGCGNGIITNELAKVFDVVGVDLSETAVQSVLGKKIVSSSHDIPLADKSFDMVFSSELLEHLDTATYHATIEEFDRLSKRYLFITVPNQENIGKNAFQCQACKHIYNGAYHLRSFNTKTFEQDFKKFKILKDFAFGKKVRFYNPSILRIKQKYSPARSWIPNYWLNKNNRGTTCPVCDHQFVNRYQFNPIAFMCDVVNVILSPKRPYWLFVLLERKPD